MAIAPLPYASGQTVLGHYRVAQVSGAIDHSSGALSALTLATGANALARVRWVPTVPSYFVLLRLRAAVGFTTAVTTAVLYSLQAVICRSFTVDYTTAMTSASMTGAAKSNALRSTMSSSQMGTAGPGICTTTVMSGQTLVGDANAFAFAPIPTLLATNSVGTAVALPVGYTTPMTTVYEWTGQGSHPPLLGTGEGILVGFGAASPATGKSNLFLEWEFAEVLAF